MTPSGCIGLNRKASRNTSHTQVTVTSEVEDGERYRTRTYDFHPCESAPIKLYNDLTEPRGLPKFAEVI
jgi:hypothetical protein